MKRKGIPFIKETLTPESKTLKGFYPAFIQTIEGNFIGAGFLGLYRTIKGDSRDIGLVDVVKGTDGDSRDIGLGYGFKFSKNSYGIEFLSILNYIEESASGLKGSVYNRCKRAKDFLINFGVVNRAIEEPDQDIFLLQFGVYNIIGDSAYPIANFRGIKNFVPQLKKYVNKHYSKDSKEESKKEVKKNKPSLVQQELQKL